MLPPIRYPLPTLVGLVLASLLAWQGAEWSKDWRASMARRVTLALEGPPVPNSARPQVLAGPITKRGLLLSDLTPVLDRPNGSKLEPIDRRMFVDLYDSWPSPGPVSHVRVGNKKAAGWIAADAVLLWDTRLVLQAPEGRLTLADSADGPGKVVEVGRNSLPVLRWSERAVEVAVWDGASPWSKVARVGWVRKADLPAQAWGVWISQVELTILLGLANQGDPTGQARTRAVLGRLAESRTWTPKELIEARAALPSVVFAIEPNVQKAAGRLAEANARPSSEAGWSGLAFRFLPLSDLP